MVKSLVSKLSSASNLSIASTLSSVGSGGGGVGGHSIQETNYAKHRNDPGRFFGDGVQFKAKLIGILEVAMARGDRMCQDALQDLKMAIRAAGEHKQRITIHVTIDGLRLRDEKTGDSLYHHPVHKISFIAQDMTDSRAFGYIFGNPENGHRFFGIKTDKAASQVVLAMRDLFQVVFELKKKEIELARQQIQSKAIHDHQIASQSSLKSSAAGGHNDLGGGGAGVSNSSAMRENTAHGGPTGLTRIILETKGAKEMSPESVADLVDLEQELCSIQRGITQMERITPNDPIQPLMSGAVSSSCSGAAVKTAAGGAGEEDPFGDSFTHFPSYNLLPPPESGRSRHKPNKLAETSSNMTGAGAGGSKSSGVTGSLLSPADLASNSPASGLQQQEEDDSWLHELDHQNDVFDTSKAGVMGLGVGGLRMAPLAPRESSATPTQQLNDNAAMADVEMSANSTCAGGVIVSTSSTNAATCAVTTSAAAASLSSPVTAMLTAATTLEHLQSSTAATAVKSDAFTDLDPLGIGRTRPYVDKKYFFQELKNPPKKVLKDLSSSSTASSSAAVGCSADISTSIAVATAPHSGYIAAASSAVVDEFLSKEVLFDDTIASISGMEVTAAALTTTAATLMTSEPQLHQQLQQQQSLNVTTNTINNTTTGTGIGSSFLPSCTTASGTSQLYIGVRKPQITILTNISSKTTTTTTITNTITTTNTTSTNIVCTCPTNIIRKPAIRYKTNTTNNLLTSTSTTNTKTNMNYSYSTAAVTSSTGGGKAFSKLKYPSPSTTTSTQTVTPTNLHLNHYTLDPPPSSTSASAPTGDLVMLPRDTDPFSPTRKKSDPFQEGGDIFSNLDPFEFEFAASSTTTATATKATERNAPTRVSPSTTTTSDTRRSADVFNGPLQVNLPPEREMPPPLWKGDISRLERQSSESPSALVGNNTTPAAIGAITVTSMVRSRPTPSGQQLSSLSSTSAVSVSAPSSVFKQQTAEVLSSISNKKMPHLFGQARFSKRDSNSINMRRLQESDSLSENETAPEPPPRPDSVSHIEPPPLPPKKQFNDIIIRPRVTSSNVVPPALPPLSNSISSSSRYEFLTASAKAVVLARNGDVPPIPLPSRRIGRSDAAYPGPGRPRKPGHTEDDYLAPIGANTGNTSGGSNLQDVPPLLPPPTQSSTRARPQRQQSISKAQDIYENKTEILQHQQQQHTMIDDDGSFGASAAVTFIPDITLSQLLTLGIDELAVKLNVPMSKLSTMTLVELTSYLSEFIEKSKPTVSSVSPVPVAAVAKSELQPEQSAVFKVSFDQQTTFMAKFDDTFGEDTPAQRHETFVANFAQFNEPPVAVATDTTSTCTPAVPPADRYAVFREIIDQELQHQLQETDLIGDLIPNDEESRASASTSPQIESVYALDDDNSQFEAHFDEDDFLGTSHGTRQLPPPPQPPRIDTKITEVVAQAKDRYAALRDIILVENLFDKRSPVSVAAQDHEKDLMQEFPEFSGDEFNDDQDLKQIMDDRASSGGPDRVGLVDSRGFPAEPSSSALTVEDDDEEFDEDGGAESSLDSNDKDAEVTGGEQDKYEKLSTSTQQLDVERGEKAETNSIGGHESISPKSSLMNGKQGSKFLTVSGGGGSGSALSSSKDDLEIDELMQRAISNLSLDSRERISPANSTNATNTTAMPRPQNTANTTTLSAQSQFSDVSTSPIPLQKSPVQPARSTLKSPSISKSPQASPVLSHLSAVSNLIDTATKQMSGSGSNELATLSPRPTSKESWATFDTPKTIAYIGDAIYGGGEKRTRTSAIKSGKATASLHLPPPPPSNTSQNDTADSPCSSDPRDDGWSKGVGGSGGRRWTKKERHHTSSSSRDLSPWDDETPDYQKQKRIMMPSSAAQMAATTSHAPPHPDRHGYYMRHARRMNSCDEDYDYEEDFGSNRRDHRKLKQGLSRSRDNFDLDSPSWYHHSAAHHTWSPQDIEQARARSFERSAYERTTYGPPIYDKRGVGVFPVSVASSSYDRRSGGGGYDKRKYYRDYARPNYDYDEYGESPVAMPERYRETGSFEKLKLGRRSDYENIYDDGRSPMSGERVGVGYKTRSGGGGPGDYMYERDRKSFDRESVESFESATRRRRSFGSGDVYGSLESREDFRDRYMGGGVVGPEKTRSLRKGMKMRTAGDIDYEQDSENDFPHQIRPSRSGGGIGPIDTRSVQRPNQLAASAGSGGVGLSQTRMRKSSGSSPWDGEEPPLPGQKSWKSRPTSVADSERRLAESRRAAALGQTPSGSDGEKDRRFRKKQRARGKDLALNSSSGCAPPPPSNPSISAATSGGRYSNPISASGVGVRNVYLYNDDVDIDLDDYVDKEEYDEPPTDEDKFERLNRRRHEMHQRMLDSEKRRQHTTATATVPTTLGKQPTATSVKAAIKKYHTRDRDDYEYDDYDEEETPTPRSIASVGPSAGSTPYATDAAASANTKFSFDGGFESDFNQSSSPPPPAPEGTASSCGSTPAAAGCSNKTPAAIAAVSTTKSSFRFSNDFSERGVVGGGVGAQNPITVSNLQLHQQQQQQFDLDAITSSPSQSLATPPITQKLRFDDNVKVSQFDDAAFEDDFSNAQFDFEKEDQWRAESLQTTASSAAAKKHNLRNSKLQQRQELIKKSESINIFGKKSEDPFEDDEFFKAPSEAKTSDNGSGGGGGDGESFQWDDDNNFAKFDENM